MNQNFIRSIEGMNRTFRFSPEPFAIDYNTWQTIQKLGPLLLKFYQAVNKLYAKACQDEQLSWVYAYLNAGKSEQVIDYGRMRRFKQDLPFIIRPDIIISKEGLKITELDSIPGGFGLLGSLSSYYSQQGFDLIGGTNGIAQNFAKAIRSFTKKEKPNLAIVVSQESHDYFSEMVWVSNALNDLGLSSYTISPQKLVFHENGLYIKTDYKLVKIDVIYRFFELFDLKNIPKIDLILYAVRKHTVLITPPLKSYLEEKMVLALFHHPVLESFWKENLGDQDFNMLQKLIPYTWVLDNRQVPPHAVIQHLEIDNRPVTNWNQLKNTTKRQRQFVLKISGYSELAWGSRGISVGHDMSNIKWTEAVDNALLGFPDTPYILQKFDKGKQVSTRYYAQNNQIRTMSGRVRLCPYYMVEGSNVHLSGILATICPLDKKLIHGMVDAVMVPTTVNRSE